MTRPKADSSEENFASQETGQAGDHPGVAHSNPALRWKAGQEELPGKSIAARRNSLRISKRLNQTTLLCSDLTQRVQELQSMETRFHTQEVVENPNPHQNRKDNPPQELRCGRAHVSNIGDQGHHQGYPGPAGHGGEGALDPQRKLKQRQGKNPERRDNAAEL